jgi:hypothetical protein
MTIEEIMWKVEPRKTLDSGIIRGKIKQALLIQEEHYEKLLNEQKVAWIKACNKEKQLKEELKQELVKLILKDK